MIHKPCEKSWKLLALEAICRRLSDSHPKRGKVEEHVAKYLAGYKGEQSLTYYLETLPKNEFHIFHDLRLAHEQQFFQIDVLLLSSRFILILEVKHISGFLTFDHTYHQLLRTSQDGQTMFPDPIIQVMRQSSFFKKWLGNYDIPIEFLVVLTNPAAIIQDSLDPARHMRHVIRGSNLTSHIETLQKRYPIIITTKETRHIIKSLLEGHSPLQQNLLAYFQLSALDFKNGVQCPSCHQLPMQRVYNSWHCQNCKTQSKDAHLKTLSDYALLFSPNITNAAARIFLQLPSPRAMRRLLIPFTYEGKTKNRTYTITIAQKTTPSR